MAKVLFVASVSSHIKFFHLPYIEMLQAQGHRVEVACHCNLPLELPVVRELPLARSPYSCANITACIQLRRLLISEQYDLVHVHTPTAAFFTRLAARGLPTPVLYTAHGFHFYRGAPWHYQSLYFNMERLAARWTAGLIVINREDLQAAKGFGLIEGHNLFYVPGVGVDLSRFGCSAAPNTPAERTLTGAHPAGALLEHPDGEQPQALEPLASWDNQETPVAVCIAEFIPRKNHALLLDAWRHVIQVLPQAKLLLVGAGSGEEAMRRRVSWERLAGSVLFLGYRPDIPAILSRANLLVLASEQEGLPRVVLEAMAAAKPVVVTDVRGSRDLVQDGVTGLVVPPGQAGQLGAAMTRLLQERDLAVKMGAAGRTIVAGYSLDAVMPQMQAIYDRYLGR